MIEVEAKVSVRNPKEARRKALALGKFIGREKKIDEYYTLEDLKNYPKKSLRIRKVDGYYVVNFKQPVGYKAGIWAKKEVEFQTSSIEGFLKLIGDFGFRKWLTKEKECETFRISKNFQIELNKVKGLGWFVEVECLTNEKNIGKARKDVSKVLEKLGYSERDSIKSGYTKQLWEKAHKR